MFNRLDYTRFGVNPNRNGFNSIKQRKSQRYLVVKQAEELTQTDCQSDVFDDFNKIEFSETKDEHNLEYHEMFPEPTQEFENNLEKQEEAPPVVSSSLNPNHEIIKMKAMSQFLNNLDIRKQKKQSQKYERKI